MLVSLTVSSLAVLQIREHIINRWELLTILRSNALTPCSFPALGVSDGNGIINFILAEFVVGYVTEQKHAKERKTSQSPR